MRDYKETLNLPDTDFPMKAQLSEREPQMLARWKEKEIYSKIRTWAHGRKTFILHDGPPYANGRLHLGHALNKILKDIVLKSKTLSGYDCPYIPGWDCHGLPIEREIEKKLKKSSNQMDPIAFRQACREYARAQIEIQKTAFVRLGILGDWDNHYSTMDPPIEAGIIRAFANIYEKGFIQKGHKPVHWCTDCRSSLAEAEVEYADKTSDSIDVKFPVLNPKTFVECFELLGPQSAALLSQKMSVVIWTTTPWTLPANQAVAVHPSSSYVLLDIGGESIVVAESLVEKLNLRYGLVNASVVGRAMGSHLLNQPLAHPFLGHKTVPILTAQHVTLEDGTGCVHTAPAHGLEDYVLGTAHGLSMAHSVLPNGCFDENSGVPALTGVYVLKANALVMDLLEKNGVLMHHANIRHSYPHCWRHKIPVIFRATPQWFMSLSHQGLREKTLSAIQQVKWIPEWGLTRMEKMVAQRPDWCISRQRVWCVPIAFFIHEDTQTLHPDTLNLLEKSAQIVEQGGIEAWYSLDLKTLLGEDYQQYRLSKDTLDVWFDSGVTHASVLKHTGEQCAPADLYLEGSDQHRGWFGSSLMTSMALNGIPPYQSVLTHGFTVDIEGRKMSKSLGNVIEPSEIIEKSGADILRLWVAASDYRGDITVSHDIFKHLSDIYRRIRNTARFLLSNLAGFDPRTDLLTPDALLSLDLFILQLAQKTQLAIQEAYETYQFNIAYQKIHHFCSLDLGAFYLDIIKDRQYTTQKNSKARRSAQSALYILVQVLAQWIAPILSFTAEEIGSHIPGNPFSESIFLTLWRDDLPVFSDQDVFSEQDWRAIMRVRDAVNQQIERLRAQGQIGASLQASVVLYAKAPYDAILHKLKDELRFVLLVSAVSVEAYELKRPEAVVLSDLPHLAILVGQTHAAKCVRCWHYVEDVGQSAAHPELCGRCVSNVEGTGEVRAYA
jgi:isoleucyl-tRNA synthetase